MDRLIAHPKVLSAFVAALSSAPGALLAQLPEVQNVATLLTIFTTTLGLAAGLLGLWIHKINSERDSKQTQRDDELKALIASLNARVDKELLQMLLELGEKYPAKEDILERVGKVDAKADSAHKRLDAGAATLHEYDRRLAVLETQYRDQVDSRRRLRDSGHGE